jgi:hypothetical protein
LNKKTRKYLIFFSGLILVLGIYGLMMLGLKDFNIAGQGPRIDSTYDTRTDPDHQFQENETYGQIGRAVGYILWDAKGIDIVVVGIMLFIASESAATMVKGIEEQCAEFRTEMCETDKFIILERKEMEEESSDEEDE